MTARGAFDSTLDQEAPKGASWSPSAEALLPQGVVSPTGGHAVGRDNPYLGYTGAQGGTAAATKDDLDRLVDELAEDDPAVTLRVAAALERRELARQLADRRRQAGLTQSELAKRMGTSQGQVTRFESGADTRLSTVARYAAAVGMKVEWSLAPIAQPEIGKTLARGRAPQRARA